jgi:hypothetical protein
VQLKNLMPTRCAVLNPLNFEHKTYHGKVKNVFRYNIDKQGVPTNLSTHMMIMINYGGIIITIGIKHLGLILTGQIIALQQVKINKRNIKIQGQRKIGAVDTLHTIKRGLFYYCAAKNRRFHRLKVLASTFWCHLKERTESSNCCLYSVCSRLLQFAQIT